MALPRLEHEKTWPRASLQSPFPREGAGGRCAHTGPALITAGKLQSCNSRDEREKQRGEEKKNTVICCGQQCDTLQMAQPKAVVLSSIFSGGKSSF